ncbi:MAG: DNA-3-methyladenine glycosylase I [Acidimicrobiia bacterium]
MFEAIPGPDGIPRCGWCLGNDDYVEYHDSEWGMPVADDRRLFEKLCLEGFQSGLSWLTILRKRETFRRAFSGFEIAAVASYGAADVERLLRDPSIVRHRGKIEACVNNARQTLELIDTEGTLASFVWRYEPAPGDPHRTTTPEAIALARELKRRGFKFVGPTTAYAFMQSMGLANDHVVGCAFRSVSESARASFARPAR